MRETPEETKEELKGLREVISDTLDNPSHVLPELLQNADDIGGECSRVTIQLTDDALIFQNHNEPMTAGNVEALSAFTESTKQGDLNLIGHFGIGFKTVFSLTDTPYIHSGYFSFKYSSEDTTIPIPVEYENQPATDGRYFDGTTVVLPFTEDVKTNRREIVEQQARDIDSLLPFLNNITTLTVVVYGEQTTYRREVIDQGGLKIFKENDDDSTLSSRIRLFSETFYPEEELLKELAEKRHLDIDALQQRNPKLEITLAVPIDTTGAPTVKDESHLFCYFPTDSKTQLPFDIQADFSLDPDRKSIAWPDEFNKELLRLVPEVFETAFIQFHQELVPPSRILSVLPDPTRDRPQYVEPVVEEILTFARSESCVPDRNGNLFQLSEAVFLDQPFRDLFSENEVSTLLDRQVRYPSEELSMNIRDRLQAIVSEGVLDVEELLQASIDSSICESKTVPWFVRFMAALNEYWNSEYDRLYGLDREEKASRDTFQELLLNVPFLPLDDGNVTSYSAADGEVYRIRGKYADEHQLFVDEDRLNLVSSELLSVLKDPRDELQQEASAAKEFLEDPLGIPILGAKDIVRKVINPAFREGSIQSNRADQFVLFVSKRPALLEGVADIKLQARDSDVASTDSRSPDTLFLGGDYIDEFDSEVVFDPFEDLAPVSNHYLELDDRTREEWADALATLGVKQRIEVLEEDPWESDRFTTKSDALEFLDRNEDTGKTKIHDEEVLDGYNGTKNRWRWMKRESRRGEVKNYKYAFIDQHLSEETRSALQSLSGNGKEPNLEYWKEFLRMLDSGWEEYYKEKIYRSYRYSQKKKKYRVEEGDCYCPSSFGDFLRETTWSPGSDGGLHQPQTLFVRNDQTRDKPVTFVEPTPNSHGLVDYLGFQQHPGIQVTVNTLQETVETYRDGEEDIEIEPVTIEREIRSELWAISRELDKHRSDADDNSTQTQALQQLKDVSFIYIEGADPAFRTPDQVTWEGPSLGEYLVPISGIYPDFKSLFVNSLDIHPDPTLEDSILFLGRVGNSSEPSDENALPWADIETSWRRVLQNTVYVPNDQIDGSEDPLDHAIQLLKEDGCIPTAGRTVATWEEVRFHTTDLTLLTNAPFEIQEQVLHGWRNERYTDTRYTERLEQLTGTKPLKDVLEREITTDIEQSDFGGSLYSEYSQLLDAAYSYFSSTGDSATAESVRSIAELPLYRVDELQCRYTLDNQLNEFIEKLLCLIESEKNLEKQRILLSSGRQAGFALIDAIAQELQLSQTERKKFTGLLKGTFGKPDSVFQAYLEDSGYEYHQLPILPERTDHTDSTTPKTAAAGEDPITDNSNNSKKPQPTVKQTSNNSETAETETPVQNDILETKSQSDATEISPESSRKEERSELESKTEQASKDQSHFESQPSNDHTPTTEGHFESSTDNQKEISSHQSPSSHSTKKNTVTSSSREKTDSSTSEPKPGVADWSSSAATNGNGGSEQSEIGNKGESFVIERIRKRIEQHFESEGELINSDISAWSQDWTVRGHCNGREHSAQIKDVSNQNTGYDIRLEGVRLSSSKTDLSIADIDREASSFIEVKSTKVESRQFTVSLNEYWTAITEPEDYTIVRVHNAVTDPTIDRVFHTLPEFYEEIHDVKYRPAGVQIKYGAVVNSL